MNGILITTVVLLSLVAIQFVRQRWARVVVVALVVIMWSWVAHLQDLRDAKTINQFSFAIPNIVDSIQKSATQQNWTAVSEKLELVKLNCNKQANPHLKSSFLLYAMNECWAHDAIGTPKESHQQIGAR